MKKFISLIFDGISWCLAIRALIHMGLMSFIILWASSSNGENIGTKLSEQGKVNIETSRQITQRKYSQMPPERAQQLFKDIVAKGDVPKPPMIGSWKFPTDNIDVIGININENDSVILVKIKSGVNTVLLDSEGLPEVFPKRPEFTLNYLFATTVDLELINNMLFGGTTKDWVSIDPILKKGVYLWSIGVGGIYLNSNQSTCIIPFRNPFAAEIFEGIKKEKASIHFKVNFDILSGEKNGILIKIADGNDLILK